MHHMHMDNLKVMNHQDSEFHSSQFETILTQILPTCSQNSNLIRPRSESFPIIIMLVCKINMFKSVINKTLLLTQVIFGFKILLDSRGTKIAR